MAFVSLNPGAMLAPIPAALVSCASEHARPNLLAIAWTGTVCSQPPMVSISIRPERYSHAIVRESGEFVINLVGEGQLEATDFCGVKSGRDLDKFAACRLTPVPAEGMRWARAVGECPLYLSCRVDQVLPLGSHDLFLARVTGMGVQETLLREDGKVDLSRARLVAYRHGEYCALGETLGFFGYSVAAPEVRARRMSGR